MIELPRSCLAQRAAALLEGSKVSSRELAIRLRHENELLYQTLVNKGLLAFRSASAIIEFRFSLLIAPIGIEAHHHEPGAPTTPD